MSKFKKDTPSIAIIGVGNIADSHAKALTQVGFDLSCCAGSPGSANATRFANVHNINTVYYDSFELLKNSNKFDCILIACTIEPTLEILKVAETLKKPILVEKPVTINHDKFKQLNLNNELIRVGYNRRFYSTVQFAKNFINKNKHCFLKLEIPDKIDFSLRYDDQNFKSLRDNSVHALDLLYYLLPDLKLSYVMDYKQPKSSFGKLALLKSENNNCLINFNWNSPSNFSLSIEALPYRLELLPFEKYKLFEGLEIKEPSESFPVRQYVPKIISENNVFNEDKIFKPGFLSQAKEFFDFVNGKKPLISANLKDAFKVSDLANKIITFKS